MNINKLDVFQDPDGGGKLELDDAVIQNEEILEGVLFGEKRKKYFIHDGVPYFVTKNELNGKEVAAVDYYSKTSQVYDDYLSIAFELYNAKEDDVRDELTNYLKLERGHKVLDLTAGTGKDSAIIARKMEQGEIWVADITSEMLDVAVKTMSNLDIFKQFVVLNACALPFKDNYFDSLYSFTGLGSFADVKKGMHEMARVVKPGGHVVFCEKGVPPWLQNTEYAKILIEANPMFMEQIPLQYLPHVATGVEVKWIMDNAFYVIAYTVGTAMPKGNFEIELPGERGGSFFTRYYGKLEGVKLDTKKLAQQARKKTGKSMHKWLDDVVRNAAEKDLFNLGDGD